VFGFVLFVVLTALAGAALTRASFLACCGSGFAIGHGVFAQEWSLMGVLLLYMTHQHFFNSKPLKIKPAPF